MENEKRLIDANALLQKLSKMIDYCQTDNKVTGLTALFQVGDAVMDCPTVDAVEVVRCKDCKHWLKAKEFSPFGWCLQRVNDLAYVSYKDRMEPEDFCSKGERRDDA